ncbi:peptidylprolyl isomerase [Brackiella oedipodis]|uniref:peptidylprolyl isomerase n=1 Tax=Brackiella oedipodis TaxID=124225 RepID=UPI00056FA69E|nr:peptidylprolyl isomerase [Brackiella oedipodis]
MKLIKPLAIVTACALAMPAMAKDVATVNGHGIPQEVFDSQIAMLESRGAPNSPELRKELLEDLIKQELLSQEAEKAGTEKEKRVQDALEASKKQIIMTAFVGDYLKKHEPSEDDIKAAYADLEKSAKNQKEYKVRHILVKDEAQAKDLLKQIKAKKTSFAKAAEKSIDTGTAKEGGELGWAPAESYTPPFAEAVKAAKKGELLDKPVKSQFGYHIIEVEDSRPSKVPSYDQSKDELKQMLSQKQLADYLSELRQKAKVESHLDDKAQDSKDADKK